MSPKAIPRAASSLFMTRFLCGRTAYTKAIRIAILRCRKTPPSCVGQLLNWFARRAVPHRQRGEWNGAASADRNARERRTTDLLLADAVRWRQRIDCLDQRRDVAVSM